jgi:hypothetical protein
MGTEKGNGGVRERTGADAISFCCLCTKERTASVGINCQTFLVRFPLLSFLLASCLCLLPQGWCGGRSAVARFVMGHRIDYGLEMTTSDLDLLY